MVSFWVFSTIKIEFGNDSLTKYRKKFVYKLKFLIKSVEFYFCVISTVILKTSNREIKKINLIEYKL